MASITLSGTLLDPNSDLAIGDEIRFTHATTTGQTLRGAISLVTIPPNGAYSVPLQYGLILVEYKDVLSTQFRNLGIVTVNGDTTATTIPEILNAVVPVSEPVLLEMQALITDARDSYKNGVLTFLTYALLTAFTPATADHQLSSFRVTNDPNPALNGSYSWVTGTTYIKNADLASGIVETGNVDPTSGETVFDYVKGITDPLYGPSFTGASEYWETLSASTLDNLWVLDLDNRIVYSAGAGTPNSFYDGVFEKIGSETSIYTYLVLDSDSKILFDPSIIPAKDTQEVITARGSQASLGDRLNVSLNSVGLLNQHTYGEWFLRETRQRTRKRILNESKQLTVAFIGDSWTHNPSRYSQPTGLTLQSSFGNSGSGWTGFSWGFGTLPTPSGRNGNYDPSTTDISINGTWTAQYSSSSSPDICLASSSTAGDDITLTTSKAATSGTLYASGNSAVIRYNFDGGAWTNLTLSSGEYYSLAGMPAAGFVFIVEVVSGTAELMGVDFHNSADGVTIHKLGATGSRLQQWATQSNDASWRANLQELAPNLITILHGTNDQASRSKAQFKADGKTLVDNIRLVLPLCDVMFIAPCENGRELSTLMSDFQEAFHELSYENKCAFINLQNVFGDQFSEYASTSPRNWFNADLIHPEPLTGGRAIVDVVIRMLTNN